MATSSCRRRITRCRAEYMGRTVWVRWETRLVRIYNSRMEQIALHARHEPGKFSTLDAHIHDHKRRIIERGVDYVLDRARLIGPRTGSWAEAMYAQRGVEGIRVLQGLLQLAEKHPVAELERATALALHHGCWRLRELRGRYENRSTIMTSNRPLEDWGKLLNDVPTAGAILDRFLHHATTIAITGRSYRVKDAAAAAPTKKEKKSNEPSTAEAAS